MRALAAMKRLANANVALIGGVAPTFFNLVSDERALRARLGTEVVPHELREIIERVKRQSPEAIQEVVKDVTDVAQGRVELSPRDLDTSAAVYLALREFALEHQYDALAVSDWPLFQSELALHPGLAFSWLDEHDRIPVASEGDVLGAVTMLMVNAVSAKQSMLLDINDLDPENESVLMWHCGGSPLHFADERGVRWTNHSTLGRKTPDVHAMGAVADLVFRPQPITVARIAADGEQLFVAEARILSSRYEGFDGSRGWVGEFRMNGERLPLADLVNTIMVEGVEHHFVVGSDHHGDALHELAVWSGVRLINRIPYSHALQQGSWL
jgi:L-fucose isomerase-like protein